MKPKNYADSPIICVAGSLPDWVLSVLGNGQGLVASKVWFVYLGADEEWEEYSGSHAIPWATADATVQAVVILYDKQPITSRVLLSWRRAIEDYPLRAFRLLTRPSWEKDKSKLTTWLAQELSPLISRSGEPAEPQGLAVGEYVTMTEGPRHSDTENEFLSLTFGPMQQAVELLEYWRRRYFELVDLPKDDRESLQNALNPAFAVRPAKGEDPAKAALESYAKKLAESRLDAIRPDSIPRLLITGETGVGKTLIARNLGRARGGDEPRYIRVAIPEFAQMEETFEFAMFGFRGGAYTGAPDAGSLGMILRHLGGVVFLDEIGDATHTMQAKLLAYLDDFQIRPRGLSKSLFAPTLIVAATNRNLEEMVEAKAFRLDLLRRFPVQVKLPSLNERKDWFALIVDTLLQTDKINPQRRVAAISSPALSKLKAFNYMDGNFRTIENILTEAVRCASIQGRDQVRGDDIRVPAVV